MMPPTFSGPLASLPQDAASKLEIYADMLLKWNRRINLSGASSKEQLSDLLLDSLYLANFLDRLFPARPDDFRIWDLGAGAGLPGIPLRALSPEGDYTLVEARDKRALFLENVLAALKLPGTHVFHGRAEKFFSTVPAKAHCILSRAFMPWDKLLPFCAPHLQEGGIMVILASAPPGAMPPGFALKDFQDYPTSRGKRWFWGIAAEA